jgi:hypothetical protein
MFLIIAFSSAGTFIYLDTCGKLEQSTVSPCAQEHGRPMKKKWKYYMQTAQADKIR